MLGTNVACHTLLKRAAVGACREAHSFCGACIVSRAGSQWSHNPTHVCALHHDVQEAVRALKRRVAELEAQLQQEDAQRRGLAEQLQEAWQEQQARAGESAGAVARLVQELRGGLLGWKGVCVGWVGVWVCGYFLEVGWGLSQQRLQRVRHCYLMCIHGPSATPVLTPCRPRTAHAEARQQCEGYAGRLAEAERQLKRTEFEQAQWEWRAQDAEGKAQAGSEAAEAAHAGALRAAERRAGQAAARAAEQESQAKAAALQVLVSGCGVGVRGGGGWEGGVFASALPAAAPAWAHHLQTHTGKALVR